MRSVLLVLLCGCAQPVAQCEPPARAPMVNVRGDTVSWVEAQECH